MNVRFGAFQNDKGETILKVMGGWSEEVEEAVKAGGFDCLNLANQGEWGDFGFLEGVREFIRCITHRGDKVHSIKGFRSLKYLERLWLEVVTRDSLDFSVYTKLRDCDIRWNKNFRQTVFQLPSLRKLTLSYYESQDLGAANRPNEVRYLHLRQCRIRSLQGIQFFHKLESLSLTHLRDLEDISGISSLRDLKNLDISNCKKIAGYSSISKLTNLENISLSDVGEISDLRFLLGKVRLKTIIINSPVEFFDIIALLCLPALKQIRLVGYRWCYPSSDEITKVAKDCDKKINIEDAKNYLIVDVL